METCAHQPASAFSPAQTFSEGKDLEGTPHPHPEGEK